MAKTAKKKSTARKAKKPARKTAARRKPARAKKRRAAYGGVPTRSGLGTWSADGGCFRRQHPLYVSKDRWQRDAPSVFSFVRAFAALLSPPANG